jgi:hypothetical protein
MKNPCTISTSSWFLALPTGELSTAQPTGKPTTAQPHVLTFYSVNTNPNVVGPLYNLAVAGRFVDFNDDNQISHQC